MRKFTLKNRKLTLEVLAKGAKIVSLKYLEREILFTSSFNIDDYSPSVGQVFDEKVAWGGDICFPSVSACKVNVDGFEMESFDHGNFWTTDFSVERYDENGSILILKGEAKNFTLYITFILKENGLTREYEIKNYSYYNLPVIFADHLLLPINKVNSPSEYLNFGELSSMRVEYSAGDKLGKKNYEIAYPVKRSGLFADKLFGKLTADEKNFYKIRYKNNIRDFKYELVFKSKELPFVGYWHTEGLWPSEEKGQYNLGLELSNSNFDNLSEAYQNNSAWIIKTGESRRWKIDLDINAS